MLCIPQHLQIIYKVYKKIGAARCANIGGLHRGRSASKELKPRYDSSPHPPGMVVHDSGRHLNPLVVNAYGKAGRRLRRLCGKPLREVVERFPKKTPVDNDVGWRNAQHQLCCRLVVSFNPKAREFRYLRSSYLRKAGILHSVPRRNSRLPKCK